MQPMPMPDMDVVEAALHPISSNEEGEDSDRPASPTTVSSSTDARCSRVLFELGMPNDRGPSTTVKPRIFI
jgi:hypothetical protein